MSKEEIQSAPKKLPYDISIRLSKSDLDRIFKWYDKGFTNTEDDKPLLDRLKKIYDRGDMPSSINCYNEESICDECGKKPVEYIHSGDLTDNKITKLCSDCFKKLIESEGK